MRYPLSSIFAWLLTGGLIESLLLRKTLRRAMQRSKTTDTAFTLTISFSNSSKDHPPLHNAKSLSRKPLAKAQRFLVYERRSLTNLAKSKYSRCFHERARAPLQSGS